MARKSLSQMDGASSEFSKAASKKAGTYAKNQAKKLMKPERATKVTRKSKQADSDAAVAIVGVAAAALLYNAVTNIVDKVKRK